MTVETGPVTAGHLAEYAQVPIVFRVTSMFVAHWDPQAASFTLEERFVASPYIKDYDAISERPVEWSHRFDTSQWQLVLARNDDQCIGAAAIVMATPGVDLLEGRADLALLWDIRVAPEHRGHGVGRRIFAEAEALARAAHCIELKVETQNINVTACRFYAAMGFTLRTVREHAYTVSPSEVQYLWHKALRA
ncbi:MAG: GNAT family N-acetyltransferase [Vicinamibacterales bacterium]